MSLPVSPPPPPIGLLFGGGLDSGILLVDLLRQGRAVQPFYVRSGLAWENAELSASQRFTRQLARSNLRPLVVLDLPLADLYGSHWSVSGKNVPGRETDDEAVYLPARNAFLLIKPLVWCQIHGIDELALATLASNPFADASDEFNDAFALALATACGFQVRIVRPFAQLHKREVMQRAGDAPLELTFSCMAPVGARHCGQCNKCAERQAGFRVVGRIDPTDYVHRPDE